MHGNLILTHHVFLLECVIGGIILQYGWNARVFGDKYLHMERSVGVEVFGADG
jgi:hypothetical protein